MIWNLIDNKEWLAFETSPYVTYKNHGKRDERLLHKLCAENLLNTVLTLLRLNY